MPSGGRIQFELTRASTVRAYHESPIPPVPAPIEIPTPPPLPPPLPALRPPIPPEPGSGAVGMTLDFARAFAVLAASLASGFFFFGSWVPASGIALVLAAGTSSRSAGGLGRHVGRQRGRSGRTRARTRRRIPREVLQPLPRRRRRPDRRGHRAARDAAAPGACPRGAAHQGAEQPAEEARAVADMNGRRPTALAST